MSRMTHRPSTGAGRRAACLLALLAAACGGGERAREPAPPAAARGAAPGPLVPLAAGDPFVRDTARFGALADSSDLGTGVVALRLAPGGDSARYPWADTLVFRAEPRADAPAVAALVVSMPASGSWTYAVLGPAGAHANLLEYAYEENGIPVDSLAGGWVRGIVAWAPAGRVTGWADASDTGRVRHVRWAEHLAEHAWFFRDERAARLHDELADTVHPGVPPPTGPYTMEPLETRGRWMRVRLRWPGERCEAADTAGAQTREAWVAYLDPRGRPLVWYPSRGC